VENEDEMRLCQPVDKDAPLSAFERASAQIPVFRVNTRLTDDFRLRTHI